MNALVTWLVHVGMLKAIVKEYKCSFYINSALTNNWKVLVTI